MVMKLNSRQILSVGTWAVLQGSVLLATRGVMAAEPLNNFSPRLPVAPAVAQSGNSAPGNLAPGNSAFDNSGPGNARSTNARFDDAYTLGPGDAVAVTIFNVAEYSGNQQVLADGSLNMPAIGPVNINGLTVQEAGIAIARAYQGELRYPQVTVVLQEARPLRVAIAGEVSQPGLYTLTPEGNAQVPTVAQALQEAGGVTQAADLYQVQLRRSNGRRPPQTITLNLWDLLNNGDVRQDLPLRDGDAIVISETETVNIAQTNQLSASNLASATEDDVVIAVVGEVLRPGAYEFEGGANKGRTTVTQVVQTAGGIKPSADIRQIQVRRLTRSGSEQLIELDF